MKIRQQFTIQDVLDPFTLLEVSRALREIPNGEFLELTYTGEQIPDKLFKIIPAEEFEIVGRELNDNPKRCTIVIKRITIVSAGSNYSTNGCDCS